MKIGIYAGTFNPFHVGHNNIYEKAKEIFDDVIVAIGTNPEKNDVIGERHIPPNIKVVRFTKMLLTDMIKGLYDKTWHYGLTEEYKNPEYILVRGIRNGYDYDYENNQITVMRALYPSLKVVLIPCDQQFGHISSTMIRHLRSFSDSAVEQFLV